MLYTKEIHEGNPPPSSLTNVKLLTGVRVNVHNRSFLLENPILTVTSDLANSSVLHLDAEGMQGQVLSLQDTLQAGH